MFDSLNAKELASSVAHVSVTDLVSGETTELTTRVDSSCHFFEPFMAGGYDVQLRLDWTDRNDRGQPRLDADFRDPVTGAHDRSMRAHYSHHTDAADVVGTLYEWDFAEVAWRISVSVSWRASGSCGSTSGACGSVTVARLEDESTHG